MPVHDWTRVAPDIFHSFHHSWISDLGRALNGGLLPSAFYALKERLTGKPTTLTLERLPDSPSVVEEPSGGIDLLSDPPRVQHRVRAEPDYYASKANALVIRHVSNHQAVAVLGVVSPGNKRNRHEIRAFVRKAQELLRSGIHLLIVDLFPPGPRDPRGIHPLIWEDIGEDDFAPPTDRPLTQAAYMSGPVPEAFIRTVAVGSPLPEMPLFLTPDVYILVPLETTYQSAFEVFPAFWRDVLMAAHPHG